MPKGSHKSLILDSLLQRLGQFEKGAVVQQRQCLQRRIAARAAGTSIEAIRGIEYV